MNIQIFQCVVKHSCPSFCVHGTRSLVETRNCLHHFCTSHQTSGGNPKLFTPLLYKSPDLWWKPETVYTTSVQVTRPLVETRNCLHHFCTSHQTSGGNPKLFTPLLYLSSNLACNSLFRINQTINQSPYTFLYLKIDLISRQVINEKHS